MQVRARLEDGAAEGRRLGAGLAAGLGLLARGVDLDVDIELRGGGVGGEEVAAGLVQKLGLLEGVDAGDAEEVGDAAEGFAVAWGGLVLVLARLTCYEEWGREGEG